MKWTELLLDGKMNQPIISKQILHFRRPRALLRTGTAAQVKEQPAGDGISKVPDYCLKPERYLTMQAFRFRNCTAYVSCVYQRRRRKLNPAVLVDKSWAQGRATTPIPDFSFFSPYYNELHELCFSVSNFVWCFITWP